MQFWTPYSLRGGPHGGVELVDIRAPKIVRWFATMEEANKWRVSISRPFEVDDTRRKENRS